MCSSIALNKENTDHHIFFGFTGLFCAQKEHIPIVFFCCFRDERNFRYCEISGNFVILTITMRLIQSFVRFAQSLTFLR